MSSSKWKGTVNELVKEALVSEFDPAKPSANLLPTGKRERGQTVIRWSAVSAAKSDVEQKGRASKVGFIKQAQACKAFQQQQDGCRV